MIIKSPQVFSSLARTVTENSRDFQNAYGKGIQLIIDVTAISATPSVTFAIQGKCPVSGKYYTLLTSAAITGTGTTVLRVYPGLTVAANLVASDSLPSTWRVVATHGDADSITYSVGAHLLL
jgi:hypothetical protein